MVDIFILYSYESGSLIIVLKKDGCSYWGNKNGRRFEQGNQKGEVSQDSRTDVYQSTFS